MTFISRRTGLAGLAVLGTSALVLAGCAAAPEDGGDGGEALDFLPCVVSGTGGFDDNSFNQLAYEGMIAAGEELGVEPITIESETQDDYAPNVQGAIDQGCDFIITVGFDLAVATSEAGIANPEIDFAIVDDTADTDFDGATDSDNIKPIIFDTAQAAFLAGYAMASYSETGVVGTYGGMAFPTVSIFMDGMAQGVEYYNEENGTDVQVLGWDTEAQDGTFVGVFSPGTESFTAAQNLLDQGADILAPVGGGIYLSAIEAIEDAGSSAAMIGVDADLTVTDPTNADYFLTSILKNISTAVYDVVIEASSGDVDFTPYVGTLENGGVGIAPFHSFEGSVDPELQATLDALAASIIAGDITVASYLAG